MKTITLNQKSWHAELASYDISRSQYGGMAPTDICEYTTAILKGLFMISVLGALAVIAGVFVIFLTLDIWFYLEYGLEGGIATVFATAALVLTILGFTIAGVGKGAHMLSRKNDGFIGHARRSWKEKFCVRVEFE